MARSFKWIAGMIGLAWMLLAVGSALAAPAADGVTLAAQTGDWRCVQVNGQIDLKIRAGAGTAYPVLATRSPGEQLEADYGRIQSADGYNWMVVRSDGIEGWAVTAQLSPCDAADGGPSSLVLTHIDQSGDLDRLEIEAVSRSVVLVANVRGDRIVSTGTGTIVTPDGMIMTNAHVVEDAEFIAIAVLNDINDPPEFQFLAELVDEDAAIDVALVAIHEDLRGRPVDAADLDLPYIPASIRAEQVFRGDPVYIFGYPGIGDNYLVVTTGSIVSVENGEMAGRRMPVWYRTDAEIAPGNSGGLVVNGNGQFVGIPTFVRSESQTGGRLGGIRPAQVALLAVLDESDPAFIAMTSLPTESAPPVLTPAVPSVVTPTPPPAAPTAAPVATTGWVELNRLTLDHGSVEDGLLGIRLHVSFVIGGWAQQPATVLARFYLDGSPPTPLTNPAAPVRYRDVDGTIITAAPIIPCCDETFYDDMTLFIPYDSFGLNAPGTYPINIELAVRGDDQSWLETLGWEYITYSRR